MADLPIPFSAPMVRALLREIEKPGTGKTQTRRALSNTGPGLVAQPYRGDGRGLYVQFRGHDGLPMKAQRLRYAVGDRLYVREAWRTYHRYDGTAPRDLIRTAPIYYDANPTPPGEPIVEIMAGRIRQGMHMPRWASRITLDVTEVRVQRLQEISASDCFSEGVQRPACLTNPAVPMLGSDATLRDNAVNDFIRLWDSINGDRPGCAWRHNPWVAAYTFRPILGNIDSLEAAAA